MPAEPYHEFPLAPRDRTWDASAAVPRLRRWASRDGSGEKEQMDWGKYRKVFFWHDDNPSDFGDFKLPYCDIIDGQPHVVHNACANAKARLSNTDIPEDDKDAVGRVIDRQLARFEENTEENARTASGATREQRFGTPTEEQLAKINQLTKRPFSADQVFTFSVKMIGDALISTRFFKLSKELLEVYVNDANAGNVAFMLNHRWASFFDNPKGVFNMGRVFDSWLAESHDVEGETVAQFGSVYIPRGRVKDGVSTDEVIESIEDGSLRDVSVGIGWQEAECSICGESYYSRKCEHVAGNRYDGKLCYIIAKPPGDQFELSGVFAGAYPTAEVLSRISREARMEEVTHTEDLKRLTEGTRVMAIYSRNNVHLWVPKDAIQKASFSIGSVKGGSEKLEDEKKEELAVDQTSETPEDGEPKTAEAEVCETEATVECLSIPVEEIRKAFGKDLTADQLIQLAKDGQTLKADLLNEVLEWGVRAQGNAFAREAYAEMLATATVEQLKKFGESFKVMAKENLKTGRKTVPMDKNAAKREVPDVVFKTR